MTPASADGPSNPPAPAAALNFGPVPVDPPVLQAPMAGFTDWAFRGMVRRFGGAGLPATEMVSAKELLHSGGGAGGLPERLWGVRDEPRPLVVQIWDNDPRDLAATAARLVGEFDVSVVDINFGCPVPRVTERAQSGSYLLRRPARVGRIISRVVRACGPVPVTAKIRLGCTRDSINAAEVARVVEENGAAALTVHGRTAEDFLKGAADWQRIAEVKPHLKRIPLVGNGDLDSPQAVLDAFSRYGVDGVMIGRAALGRPWLFAQVAAALAGRPVPPDPSPDEEGQLILEHYALVRRQHGESKGTILMRKFASRYARGRPGAKKFRAAVSSWTTAADVHRVVRGYFACHDECKTTDSTDLTDDTDKDLSSPGPSVKSGKSV